MNEIGPGSRLGPYQIVALLGRGGMGAVFRAVDASGRVVALKVLPRELASDDRFVDRFKREGEAAARIRHAHITRCHGAGEDRGVLYLALELVTGGSLKDALKNGPLPWKEAARFGAEIARALEALHAAGILHRDLKPANVLVDEEGRAKLADFGLARARGMDKLTKTGEFLGTPEYMAPEMAEGGSAVSTPADLYCLGATLHELVTGEPPFAGSGPQLIVKHLTAPPPSARKLVPETPVELDRLIVRLLAKKPEERGDAARAAVELEAIARGEVAPPPSSSRFYLLAGLVVVVTVAALLLAVGQRKPLASVSIAPTESRTAPAKRPDWFLALAQDERPRSLLPQLTIGEKPGEYVNETDHSVLVFVPAGTFEMGVQEGTPNMSTDETPVHSVKLSAYFIGKYEVSNAQFRAFARDHPTGEQSTKGWLARQELDREVQEETPGVSWKQPQGMAQCIEGNPVVQITCREAGAYAEWAHLRLPTEAEWERAASWDATTRHARMWPWGDELDFDAKRVNADRKELLGVREFPLGASPVGALNMAGNAREWVLDTLADYPSTSVTDPCVIDPTGKTHQISRGGDFRDAAWTFSTHYRKHHDKRDYRDDVTGFRVALSADGSPRPK